MSEKKRIGIIRLREHESEECVNYAVAVNAVDLGSENGKEIEIIFKSSFTELRDSFEKNPDDYDIVILHTDSPYLNYKPLCSQAEKIRRSLMGKLVAESYAFGNGFSVHLDEPHLEGNPNYYFDYFTGSIVRKENFEKMLKDLKFI